MAGLHRNGSRNFQKGGRVRGSGDFVPQEVKQNFNLAFNSLTFSGVRFLYFRRLMPSVHIIIIIIIIIVIIILIRIVRLLYYMLNIWCIPSHI